MSETPPLPDLKVVEAPPVEGDPARAAVSWGEVLAVPEKGSVENSIAEVADETVSAPVLEQISVATEPQLAEASPSLPVTEVISLDAAQTLALQTRAAIDSPTDPNLNSMARTIHDQAFPEKKVA